jgi:tRNA (cytosine34-C5)-methyltransferase
MAYKLGVDRKTIRKSKTLSDFHQWLLENTSSGNVTRQEAVSMVPPVVLGVEPHHKVLDMCAAPGSKTSQILEIVSR